MDLERENELLRSIIDLRKQADYWQAKWQKENGISSNYRQLVFTMIHASLPREYSGGDFGRGQWNIMSWWVDLAKKLLPTYEDDAEALKLVEDVKQHQEWVKKAIEERDAVAHLSKKERTLARRKKMLEGA